MKADMTEKAKIVFVFDNWVRSTGRERCVLDTKREAVIRRALKSYTVEDLTAAVWGWQHSAFHRGENERGRPYNELSLILRDAEHIEFFRDLQAGMRELQPQLKGLAAIKEAARQESLW